MLDPDLKSGILAEITEAQDFPCVAKGGAVHFQLDRMRVRSGLWENASGFSPLLLENARPQLRGAARHIISQQAWLPVVGALRMRPAVGQALAEGRAICFEICWAWAPQRPWL
jgi:hypothetical protein